MKKILAAGVLVVALGIRLWVVPAAGSPLNDYFVLGNLKETWILYLAENFGDCAKWGLQTVFTVGIFVPFLILAWKDAPRNVRNPAVFLPVTLLATNATFSWMVETRNLISAVIPLALMTS